MQFNFVNDSLRSEKQTGIKCMICMIIFNISQNNTLGFDEGIQV